MKSYHVGTMLQDSRYGVLDPEDPEVKGAILAGCLNEDYSVTLFSAQRDLNKKVESAYSDRMNGWNSRKFDDSFEKSFGKVGHSFDEKEPDKIELFLQHYYVDKTICLVEVKRWVNVSSGYPVWRFTWER
jgi:hypothetical protein